MTQAMNSFLNDSGAILPSQYSDLVRRRTGGFEAERRLLWAVLDNAIDSYLANMHCATAKQRDEFEEVRAWFRPLTGRPGRLFSFESICDLLEIDGRMLLKGLESIRTTGSRANMRPPQASRPAARRGRLAA